MIFTVHPSRERNLHDQQGIGDEAQSWLEGVGATVHGVNVRKADAAYAAFTPHYGWRRGRELRPKWDCQQKCSAAPLRFQRVHAVAQRTGRINWTELALTCGFYDQRHLTNEFRRLSGLTPAQYERRSRRLAIA